MKIIKRAIETQIERAIGKNKVLLVLGTRRVGKTLLIQSIRNKLGSPMVILNGEDLEVQALLKNAAPAIDRLPGGIGSLL
jgi:predicted AAA+ superfamily ATPase